MSPEDEREEMGMRVMTILLVLDAAAFTGLCAMAYQRRLVECLLFYGLFTLSLIVGCVVREVFVLFDRNTLGHPRELGDEHLREAK